MKKMLNVSGLVVIWLLITFAAVTSLPVNPEFADVAGIFLRFTTWLCNIYILFTALGDVVNCILNNTEGYTIIPQLTKQKICWLPLAFILFLLELFAFNLFLSFTLFETMILAAYYAFIVTGFYIFSVLITRIAGKIGSKINPAAASLNFAGSREKE